MDIVQAHTGGLLVHSNGPPVLLSQLQDNLIGEVAAGNDPGSEEDISVVVKLAQVDT